MSDKNKKKNKKDSKQKKSEEAKIDGMSLAIGEMDLIFDLTLDDKDLENPKSSSEDDKYIKIEDLKSIKDLSFLFKKDEEGKSEEEKKEQEKKIQDIVNRIKIIPNSEFMKQLLLGNKISKKKTFIDLICYGRPKFEGDNEFFDPIFKQVNLKYGLQINETPLSENSRYSLIINIRHKKHPEQLSVIEDGTSPEKMKEEKKKEEDEKKEEENKKREEKEQQDNEEKKQMKEKKIQEYKEKRQKEKEQKEKNKEGGDKQNEENNVEENKVEENKDEENKVEENKGEENKVEENKAEENKEEENNDEEKEEEQEDYEETEAMKEKKIPKFKRKNVLCNLNPSCTKYDVVYLNYDEILKIPGDFKVKYLIELLAHLKKKKNTIFINFYKNEPSQDEIEEKEKEKKEAEKIEENRRNEKAQQEEKERKEKEEKLKNLENEKKELLKRQIDIKENKIKEVKDMTEDQKNDELKQIEENLKNKDEEIENLNDEIKAEKEANKEFKKKKEKEQEKEKEKEEKEKDKQNKKEMREMNEIFFLIDGYFFDTKQACELFNNHYLAHTTEKKKNRKQINKQKVFDYFITSIATGTLDEVQENKIGLFMEDLNRYNVIYCSKKAAAKKELNPQPHPKINPHNTKLVEEYQQIIKKNKNDYYSIFACLAAHEIAACHNISLEVIYPTFLIGLEIIKRKVECEKNNITSINEDQLYKVKINEKALQQELEKMASDSKESGFVLDCTNKSKSTLKDYVALYDYHLKGFFSSELIRNYLKTKKFINSEGYIMYDPVYRNVMGAQCRNKKKYEGDELKAKIITGIKGIDVPARIKDKELEVKKAVEKENFPLDKKIPFSKEMNQYKKKKKRKNKKDGSKEGSSSSGQSSSEDEGNSGAGESENKEKENIENPNQ